MEIVDELEQYPLEVGEDAHEHEEEHPQEEIEQ